MDHGCMQESIYFKSIYLYIHKLNWNCGPNISTDFLVEICQGLVDTQISRQALFYCAPHTFYVILKRHMQYFQICLNDIFCKTLSGFEKRKKHGSIPKPTTLRIFLLLLFKDLPFPFPPKLANCWHFRFSGREGIRSGKPGSVSLLIIKD